MNMNQNSANREGISRRETMRRGVAGAAGLIKSALSLKNKTLVASLGFETPNPRLSLEQSPFYVNKENRPWPKSRCSKFAWKLTLKTLRT